MRHRKLALFCCCIAFAAAGCGGSAPGTPAPPHSPAPTASPTGSPTAPAIAIEPMTLVNEASGTGYFSDPYPIRRAAPYATGNSHAFSGTTPALLGCPGLVTPGCFSETPITVQRGVLAGQAQADGSTIGGSENDNVFQDDSGTWEMVTTLFVTNPSVSKVAWNVIAHASPVSQSPTSIPTQWVCDKVLVGSLDATAPANYDGKYVENAGQLYLLYSSQLASAPTIDGIVAQPLLSPTQLAASAPTTLLAPTTTGGGYDSEDRSPGNSGFKLVETGNVAVVDGKYEMTYSVGAYDESDYKTGIAWSDTFLPAANAQYRKVLRLDAAGVWGQPNHEEVQYLLQSQIAAWPNDVAAQVLAPGVGSIGQDQSGAWYLFFAGFAPADAPIDPTTGLYDAAHRRPFFTKLDVAIPPGATVAGASDAALAAWVTPATP